MVFVCSWLLLWRTEKIKVAATARKQVANTPPPPPPPKLFVIDILDVNCRGKQSLLWKCACQVGFQ